MTSLLLEYGADIDARDIRGRTSLYIAVKNNLPDIVKLLIHEGASPFLMGIRGIDLISIAKDDRCKYILKRSRKIHLALLFLKDSEKKEIWLKARNELLYI